MKTAREITESMAEAGVISKDMVNEVERYFLRYIDGFRSQLIKDIKGDQHHAYYMVTEAIEGSVTMKNQTTACVIELIVEPTEPEEVKESIWFNYGQFEDLIKMCHSLCLK